MSLQRQLDAWGKKAMLRTEAVAKTAAQQLADDANEEGPSVANPDGGRGGRMPVHTSFLRNSIAAAVGSIPRGPSDPRTDKQGDPGAVAVAINSWNLDSPLYVGWTAVYAGVMENRYGFLEAALQKWPDYVEAAIAEAKRTIK